MILDVRNSLQASEECLLQRERRNGIELVRDNVERNLSKEVLRMRSSLETLKKMLDKVNVQIKYAVDVLINVLRNFQSSLTSSSFSVVKIFFDTLMNTYPSSYRNFSVKYIDNNIGTVRRRMVLGYYLYVYVSATTTTTTTTTIYRI